MILPQVLAVLGFLILFLLPGTALGAEDFDFDFGERPDTGLFDPKGILAPGEAQKISESLDAVLDSEGIDIIVVILPRLSKQAPQRIAERFRDEWSKSPVNAVVLHIPGKPGSPWIVPSELIHRVVEKDQLREWVEAGEKRASSQPDDFGKIRTAAEEATGIIRYCSRGGLLRTEEIIRGRLRQKAAQEKRGKLTKLASVLGLAAVIPLLLTLWFYRRNSKQGDPKLFPPVKKISRLGAPYTGGNNAVVGPKKR